MSTAYHVLPFTTTTMFSQFLNAYKNLSADKCDSQKVPILSPVYLSYDQTPADLERIFLTRKFHIISDDVYILIINLNALAHKSKRSAYNYFHEYAKETLCAQKSFRLFEAYAIIRRSPLFQQIDFQSGIFSPSPTVSQKPSLYDEEFHKYLNQYKPPSEVD